MTTERHIMHYLVMTDADHPDEKHGDRRAADRAAKKISIKLGGALVRVYRARLTQVAKFGQEDTGCEE